MLVLMASVLLVAAAGVLSAMAAESGAEQSAWVRTDQSAVRLVAASPTVGEATALRLGLELDLAPGWKTYWRSPGDAGYPPRLDWAGSTNLAEARILWPAPQRFQLFGLETFGYEGRFLLPIEAKPAQPGQPVRLRLSVDYLICEKICIPYTAALSLDLAAGPLQPGEAAHAIDRFVARVPGSGEGAGLAIERASWIAQPKPLIEVLARAEAPFVAPDVFVETAAGLSFGPAEASLTEGGRRARLRLPLLGTGAPPVLAGAAVTLTLADGERAMERTLDLVPGTAPAASGAGFFAALGLAVLGGLILNLMPCVLPVLSLKLLGAINHAGAARTRVRSHFLASAGGILAAFWALALATIGLRQAGFAIGWGFQFQSSTFLAFMIVVLTLFAANLWEWLELRLPSWLVTVAGTPKGDGDETLAGAALTGVFATLLATPCSAPFLGTAIGFALARGPAEILAIFTALGLGLALPYLSVAVLPGLATHLPRPGRWMVGLRRVLGVGLAGSAIWLITVLAVQAGAPAGIGVAALMLALAALLRLTRGGPDGRRWRASAAASGIGIAALLLPAGLDRPPEAALAPAAGAEWRSFEASLIPGLVGEGKVVFVDVTAQWCLTCQANKALVLDRGEVAARLGSAAIVRLRADWTRPDETIARYLASFGRFGIPFNVVYGPGAPDGIALPELLSQEAVLGALDRAGAAIPR